MRYQVRQKIFALGDSFTIKDESGMDVYKVNRQLLSFGKKLRIYDMMDNELCYIEQIILRFLPEYNLYIGGQLVANVKKKLAFFKNDFVIKSQVGDYFVDGNIFAREFNIIKDGTAIAYISKKFFSFTDIYGVEIDDGQDQLTNLALAIVIDMVCHDKNH